MNKRRSMHSSCFVDNELYVFAGQFNNGAVHTVEVLDLRIGDYWNLINVPSVSGCSSPIFC